MSQETKIPVFTERFRLTLLERRVLVLDGVLDDDNGTLLAAQFLGSPTRTRRPTSRSGSTRPAARCRRCSRSATSCGSSRATCRPWRSASPAAPGQFLLSAGTHGKRFALPHARILMHQGSAGIGGSAVEVELQAADLRQTRDTVLGLIAADTGQPVERIFEDSRHDHWYTAARPGSTASSTPSPRRSPSYAVEEAAVRAAPEPHQRAADGARHEQLHHPQRHRRAPAGRPDHGRLLAPADRADRRARHARSTRAWPTR